MNKTKILVVEDESIVAKDIQATLIRLGYDVPALAASANAAYIKLEEVQPDLVFLDIKLKGEQDGIHVAEHIKEAYDIPVVFLTSYVDQPTLDRAKITQPYGYLVKPFNENDLKTTIEMALYKFKIDQETRQNEKRFENALQNLDDAIIITDTECRVTFLNPKSESLTGYGNDTAQSISVFKLIKIENEEYNLVNCDSLNKYLLQGEAITIGDCNITIMRDYSTQKGNAVVSPIRDEKNQVIGKAFLLRTGNMVSMPEEQREMPAATMMGPLENSVLANFFFVKKGAMLVRVALDNILWIQAMDNYVIVQTPHDQFVVHVTMKDLEIKLPQERFARIHRSYIVAMDKIHVMDENSVVIQDKTLPVGKSYKDSFMAKINLL